jgi:hypothetical protein
MSKMVCDEGILYRGSGMRICDFHCNFFKWKRSLSMYMICIVILHSLYIYLVFDSDGDFYG